MPDALELLAADHQEVRALFSQIAATAARQKRRTLVSKLIHALSRHASVEEQLFYPVIRERVMEGEGFVTASLEEHAKAAEQMRKLDRLQPGDPLFDPSIGELHKEVLEHIADEEMQLFPRVRAAFSPDELATLGTQLAAGTDRVPEGVR
jgi:hemerythrin superfamily protein